MRKITKTNNYRMFNTLLIIYAMIFTFVVPTQIFGETFPENSVFNQKANEQIEKPNTDESFGKIPVYFEENQGQFNSKVRYFARGTSGYSLF